ncbi:N-terminal domain of Peptidase_S41 [Chitinophaga costaii]|uniref:N-terminal domain of Peptidase_S41 n=1 Tax=Chitinophaga costaii TaxID=1335309 RepID=A0A1C4E3J7_9BACT|nr:S41 family peptidase [Chitinophaga costaii]PUZ24341.1 hypothetical protein DCM91_13000 [Chitinophaga costaii]SCC38193.1 N-terminal domain of Peptidase_S41 [Chitinophaga costaii]
MKKSLLLCVCLLAAQRIIAQTPSPLLSAATKTAVVTRLQKALTDHYVFLDTARNMGNYVSQRLQSGAYNTLTTPDEFSQALTADLRHIYRDMHLNIYFDSLFAASLEDTTRHTPPSDTPDGGDQNYGFRKIELLHGNVGYILLDGFHEPTPAAKGTVQAVFNTLRHCNALVLDLRFNGGGSPDMVQYICSFLLPPNTHINDLYQRRNNTTERFYTLPVDSSHYFENIPVYVLTSHRTFSAAEECSYNLQTQHRVTLVGDTTGGGAHPVAPVTIGHGFIGNIPYARAINPVTLKNWEGTGVAPDINVAASTALDAALLHYYNTQLRTAKDAARIRKLQWAKDLTVARIYPPQLDSATLKAYTGHFDEREVTYANGQLYILRNGQQQQLLPLSATTFKLADYDYVKLTFSKQAQEIIYEYDDGFTTVVKRKD